MDTNHTQGQTFRGNKVISSINPWPLKSCLSHWDANSSTQRWTASCFAAFAIVSSYLELYLGYIESCRDHMPRKTRKHTLDVLMSKTDYCKMAWFKMQGFTHGGDQAHVCSACLCLCRRVEQTAEPSEAGGWSSFPSRQHRALKGGEAGVPRGLCVLHQDFHPTARFGMDLQALKKQQH